MVLDRSVPFLSVSRVAEVVNGHSDKCWSKIMRAVVESIAVDILSRME